MRSFNTAKKMKSIEKVVNYFKIGDSHVSNSLCSPMKIHQKQSNELLSFL